MKVGILTQPLHSNYGGILQNMALQTVLRRAGHEVLTLNHAAPEKSWFSLLKWEVKKRFRHAAYDPGDKGKKVLFREINDFIGRNMEVSPVLRSEDAICRYAEEGGFNAFVVGSDQCWRPSYNPFIKLMFLPFCEGRKDVARVAYAASFGTEEWEFDEKLTAECAELLHKFDGVSVREDSGVAMCQERFETEARLVLDPTMLLSREEYEALAGEEPVGSGIMVHILDPGPDKNSAIESYSKEKGLETFSILPRHQIETLSLKAYRSERESCLYASPEKYIRAFMDADEVVTDSYHTCVFSIIFNKDFRIIENGRRGNARFESLLRLFALEDRIVSPGNLEKPLRDIDWAKVNSRLAELKKDSLNFLVTSLSREK